MVPCHPPRVLSGVGWGQPCPLGPLAAINSKRWGPGMCFGCCSAVSPCQPLSLSLPCPYSSIPFPCPVPLPPPPSLSLPPGCPPDSAHPTAVTFIYHINRFSFWGCKVISQCLTPRGECLPPNSFEQGSPRALQCVGTSPCVTHWWLWGGSFCNFKEWFSVWRGPGRMWGVGSPPGPAVPRVLRSGW